MRAYGWGCKTLLAEPDGQVGLLRHLLEDLQLTQAHQGGAELGDLGGVGLRAHGRLAPQLLDRAQQIELQIRQASGGQDARQARGGPV